MIKRKNIAYEDLKVGDLLVSSDITWMIVATVTCDHDFIDIYMVSSEETVVTAQRKSYMYVGPSWTLVRTLM